MTSAKITSCSLCGNELRTEAVEKDEVVAYRCHICGEVALHRSFDPKAVEDKLHLLSGWTRERTEKGERALAIMAEGSAPIESGIPVNAILNLPGIPRSFTDKVNKFLEMLEYKSTYFGEKLHFGRGDYPLVYMEHPPNIADWDGFHRFLGEIKNLGWIEYSYAGTKPMCYLTIAGMQHIESLKGKHEESRNGFVAMKFGDEKLDRAYREAFAPAIREAGYNPVQMAYLEHNNNIVDEMLAHIRQSRFLVADLTYQNQNVYYEAGFAFGLDIPVIYTCCESDADNVLFDTQQSNQIRWKDEKDLKLKLKNRILATIGKG